MFRYLIIAVTTAAFAQGDTCNKVASIYRNSIVHIQSQVQTNSGATDVVEGTGFILSTDGYLLTSSRIVPSIPGVEITGAIATRSAFHVPLTVITVDDQHGLALMQLNDSSRSYQPLQIGEPQELSPGDELCSLGFPLKQEFQYSHGVLGGKRAYKGRWSTDMSVNSGESGAPVFDDKTRMVVAVKDESLDAPNLNLLVPINLANTLLSQACGFGCTTSQLGGSLRAGRAAVYRKSELLEFSAFVFERGTIDSWQSSTADFGVDRKPGERVVQMFLFDDSEQPIAKGSRHAAKGGILELPTTQFDDVQEAPPSQYAPGWFRPVVRHVYCVRTRDGRHFAKIRIARIDQNMIAFDYVYQRDSNSRSFRLPLQEQGYN